MKHRNANKPLGQCCPVLELVLARESKHGLELAPFLRLDGKSGGVGLILSFPKSKDRTSKFADSTYAQVEYCPFCGVPTERKRKPREA